MALNFEYKYYPADVYVISMGATDVSLNSNYSYTGEVEIPIGKTYLTLVNYNGNLKLSGNQLRKLPYYNGQNNSYGSNPLTNQEVMKNYKHTDLRSAGASVSNLSFPDLDDDYGTIYSGSIHRPIYHILYNTALTNSISDDLTKIAVCELVSDFNGFSSLSQEDFDQYDFNKLVNTFKNTTVRGLGPQYTTDSDYCMINKSKLNELALDYPDMSAYLCEARFVLDEETTYKYRFKLYRKTVSNRQPSTWSDSTSFALTISGSNAWNPTDNQLMLGENFSYESSSNPVLSSIYYNKSSSSYSNYHDLWKRDMIYLRANNGVFPIMIQQWLRLYSYSYSTSNTFEMTCNISIQLPSLETGAIRLIIDDFYGLGTSLPSGGGGTPIPDPSPPDPTPEPGPTPPGPTPPSPTPVNPYEPAGGVDTTDTGPTGGTFTPIHDDIDWTPQLDVIPAMGLTRWYACNKSQIQLLGQRLLTTNVLAEIVKYFVDFKSLIISLKSVPFLIDDTFNCEAESDIGFAFLGLPGQTVMTRGRKITDGIQMCSFGRVTVPRFYGNFIDYKYTTYEIYLPYLGVTALDPELVAGHEIDLTYVVDLLTGDASIQLQNVDNYDIISILNVHLSTDVALSESGNNSIKLVETLLSTAAPIAGAGAALAGNISAMPSLAPTQLGGGTPIKPEKADFPDDTQYQEANRQYESQMTMNDVYSNYQNAKNNLLNSLTNYRPHLTGSSFSSMSGVTGRLNPQKAYLLIRRPELVQSSNQSLMGYPCYIGGEISEFVGSGYTEFCDIRFEGEFLYSSQEELTLIKEALRNGVIL